MTLLTPADVGELMRYLPADHGERPTWTPVN
jgi:hypothetical protein